MFCDTLDSLHRLFDDTHAIIESGGHMKRVILLAVIQAVVLFFIIGALAYAFKGDFFYNYLAVVFAPIAGVLRFASAYATEIVLPKKAAEIAEKRKKG